jgi:heme/copper-type cytochrome/quinol oxidase subunit 2
MKTERNYSIESLLWLIATVLLIAITLSSCKTTAECDAYGRVKTYKKH